MKAVCFSPEETKRPSLFKLRRKVVLSYTSEKAIDNKLSWQTIK